MGARLGFEGKILICYSYVQSAYRWNDVPLLCFQTLQGVEQKLGSDTWNNIDKILTNIEAVWWVYEICYTTFLFLGMFEFFYIT
jgi:hypothetical protein